MFKSNKAIKKPKTAFTLIELLVVVAIISLLVSILLPSLKKAKTLAKAVICKNNFRSIGIGTAMFQQENDGEFPNTKANDYSGFWKNGMAPYLELETNEHGYINPGSREIFQCPDSTMADKEWNADYRIANGWIPGDRYGIIGWRPGYKFNIRTVEDLKNKPLWEVVWVSEGRASTGGDALIWWKSSLPTFLDQVSIRHDKKVNVLYADNSVSDVEFDDIEIETFKH